MRLKNKPGINENKKSNCEMVQEREPAKYQNPNIPEMKCSTYTRVDVWLLSACSPRLVHRKIKTNPIKEGMSCNSRLLKKRKNIHREVVHVLAKVRGLITEAKVCQFAKATPTQRNILKRNQT